MPLLPGEAGPSLPLGLTFDDLLLLPAESNVVPSEVDPATRLSRPDHAAGAARVECDGHRHRGPDGHSHRAPGRHRGAAPQSRDRGPGALQVDLVKRSEAGMVTNPITCAPEDTLRQVDALCARYRISGAPVVDGSGMLVGIVTNRDMRFVGDKSTLVRDVMTSMPLITAPVGVTTAEALDLLRRHKVEKLPIVTQAGRLAGLITVKDFAKSEQYPDATKDAAGRLRVAAAVGVGEDSYKRARTLVDAGVDALAWTPRMATAATCWRWWRASSRMCRTWTWSAATSPPRRAPGHSSPRAQTPSRSASGLAPICTTRVVAGVGVPQVTAIMDAARAAGRPGYRSSAMAACSTRAISRRPSSPARTP